MTRDQNAAVVCDNYKLRAFKRGLKAAGYGDYTVHVNKGTLSGTTTLKVPYAKEELPHLTKVIKKLNFNATNTNNN